MVVLPMEPLEEPKEALQGMDHPRTGLHKFWSLCANQSFDKPNFDKPPFLAGFLLVLLLVRRTGERRVHMASMMTSRMMTYARFSCTLGQSRRSGSIGKGQYPLGPKIYVLPWRWEDSGRKKGFGYIEFQDEEAADAACGVHKVMSPWFIQWPPDMTIEKWMWPNDIVLCCSPLDR